MKRRVFRLRHVLLILALGILSAAVVLGLKWFRAERGNPGAISPKGGESFSIVLPNSTNHFRQSDPRWGTQTIGGSGEYIASVGCTLCSVAMAVSDLGFFILPDELNQKLIENGGYTEQGWLIWGSVTPAVDGFAEIVVCGKPDHATLDACLKRGEIPVIKFFLPGGIPHWVAVIGKDGTEYLIKDPALKSPAPVKLSSRARSIHSLRYVRKR